MKVFKMMTIVYEYFINGFYYCKILSALKYSLKIGLFCHFSFYAIFKEKMHILTQNHVCCYTYLHVCLVFYMYMSNMIIANENYCVAIVLKFDEIGAKPNNKMTSSLFWSAYLKCFSTRQFSSGLIKYKLCTSLKFPNTADIP